LESLSRPGLLEPLLLWWPERSRRPLRSLSRSSVGAAMPVIRSARSGMVALAASLGVSALAGGGPGGGGGGAGIEGDDIGVSGPIPEDILARLRVFRSGAFCCPACWSIVLIPASCRLPPRAARSVAEAGPVGAASPFVPRPLGLGSDTLGPEGGNPVATGGRGGLPRMVLCCIAGGGMTGDSNAFSLSGCIGGGGGGRFFKRSGWMGVEDAATGVLVAGP